MMNVRGKGISEKSAKNKADLLFSSVDLVTASQDTKVGLMRIRDPTHGPSEYADFN